MFSFENKRTSCTAVNLLTATVIIILLANFVFMNRDCEDCRREQLFCNLLYCLKHTVECIILFPLKALV